MEAKLHEILDFVKKHKCTIDKDGIEYLKKELQELITPTEEKVEEKSEA